ncbi:PQQ-like beta-propeller repeat protein [Gemmata sp. JC673]|uniref:PQQ-like beta-propeller repeat protein n=1 Tax=Gemmata algarum TaxID=2975278 RepID=A0ABU5EU28_9BACT|nr:PQQ-binding-like beta-propeller repeat protein [Gemmata algarum]MDY3558813.1 PQQ-like beta-propeller repeat protein [Gemmata algarum]
MTRLTLPVAFLALALPASHAADWPQWMGPNRDDVWAETGIVKAFPAGGLKPTWTAAIGAGYSGPAVAGGRVYVLDRVLAKGAANPEDPFDTKQKVNSTERVLCFDAKDGKELWKREYECPYQISYPAGPRCTPTVSGGKVYSLGAMGDLTCLDAVTGDVVWAKNFVKDYGAKVPVWGFCGHPLVYKQALVCVVGGDKATAVAFDKETGKELWKALEAREPGYCPPTLIHAGGVDQVLIWHAQALNSLDPLTGKVYWKVDLEPMYGMSIMAPRQSGDLLFAGGIGACAVLKLDRDKPGASVVWNEAVDKAGAKAKARGLYPVNMTPLIEDGTIYGVDQPGMLRAVELTTGKKLWFTHKPVIGKEEEEGFKGSGSGTAFVVKNGDRHFLFSETGDLIIARLTPKGYEELSRTHLLDPTGAAFGRKVLWTHPAFANKSVYIRNDKELACFSLAE